jgi:hypothetical protein
MAAESRRVTFQFALAGPGFCRMKNRPRGSPARTGRGLVGTRMGTCRAAQPCGDGCGGSWAVEEIRAAGARAFHPESTAGITVEPLASGVLVA